MLSFEKPQGLNKKGEKKWDNQVVLTSYHLNNPNSKSGKVVLLNYGSNKIPELTENDFYEYKDYYSFYRLKYRWEEYCKILKNVSGQRLEKLKLDDHQIFTLIFNLVEEIHSLKESVDDQESRLLYVEKEIDNIKWKLESE